MIIYDGTSSRSHVLWPEQEGVFGMKDVFQNFTVPGFRVLDPCADTFAIAKTWMLLPKHRRFVVCKIDSGFLSLYFGSGSVCETDLQ